VSQIELSKDDAIKTALLRVYNESKKQTNSTTSSNQWTSLKRKSNPIISNQDTSAKRKREPSPLPLKNKTVLSKTEAMYKKLLEERDEIERSVGDRRGFYYEDSEEEDKENRQNNSYSCYQEEYEDKYGYYVDYDAFYTPKFQSKKHNKVNTTVSNGAEDKYLVSQV